MLGVTPQKRHVAQRKAGLTPAMFTAIVHYGNRVKRRPKNMLGNGVVNSKVRVIHETIVVHRYENVDIAILVDVVLHRLGDFERFTQEIGDANPEL